MKYLVLAVFAVAGLCSLPAFARQGLRLRCEPSTLASGNDLRLAVDGPKGRALRELGVLTPRGKFLFIAFAPENGVHTSRPPVPSDAFLAMRKARLNVSSLMGVDLTADTVERVFVDPGRYTFVASENLETEDEAGANPSCYVRYTVKHRLVAESGLKSKSLRRSSPFGR